MSYVGNTPTQQAFSPAVDYFSGDGSTTAFTLSRPVASVAQVQVTVNNVPQNPSTAFTVSSNTITFTGAPSSGTNNIYVQYTSPITQLIAPSQGTVGAAQLQDNAVTTAKIADTNVTLAKLARVGTSGQVLTSNGAGADPSYQALPSGGVTSAVAGNGVAVSAATGAVTFSAAAPTYNSVGSYAMVCSTSTSASSFVAGSNYSAGTGSGLISSAYLNFGGCPLALTVSSGSVTGTWKWMSTTSGAGAYVPTGIAVRVA